MALKRIRCVCGKIYNPASHTVCPDCDTQPPTLTPQEPPSEPEKNGASDNETDRRDNPVIPPRPLPLPWHSRHIVLGLGLLILGLGIWLIVRPPSDDHHDKKSGPGKESGHHSQEKGQVSETPKPDSITPTEFAGKLAKAAPGATIHLAPGTYAGGFTISRAVHLMGDSTGGEIVIKSAGQNTLEITAPGVILENIRVTVEGGGKFNAISVRENATLDLRQCVIDTTSQTGVLLDGSSNLTASKTRFSTSGQGSGCQAEENSRAVLDGCTFQDNQWGFSTLGSAQGELRNCQLQRCGLARGSGSILSVVGGKAAVTVDKCTFTDNPAGIFLNESGSITITGSTFKNNGVTGDQGNSSSGLIGAKNLARVTLAGNIFDSNRQGIALLGAATAEIIDCEFTNTGLKTDNRDLIFYCNTVSAAGTGTSVVIRKSTIAHSFLNALNVVEGAALTIEDSTVTDSLWNALVVGIPNTAPCKVTVTRCQFLRNGLSGVQLVAGSTAEIQDTVSNENGSSGFDVSGSRTSLTMEKGEASGNQSVGLIVYNSASASATGSVFNNNDYGVQAGLPDGSGHGGTLQLSQCRISGNTSFGAGALRESTLYLGDSVIINNRENIHRVRGGTVKSAPSSETDDSDSENRQSTPRRTPSRNRKSQEIIDKVLQYIPR